MQPEVEYLLDSIGTSAEEVSVPLMERRYFYPDGRVDNHRAPQLMTAWDTLYRTLRAPLAGVCYRQDSRLVDLAVEGGQVVVSFADGYRTTGNLLVGADGVNSTCRELLNGEIRPVYSGYVAWRGLEGVGDFPRGLVAELADRFTLFAGEGMQFLCYLVPPMARRLMALDVSTGSGMSTRPNATLPGSCVDGPDETTGPCFRQGK